MEMPTEKENQIRNRNTKYISIDTGKCKACWDCIDECENDVLGKVNLWFHKHVVFKNPEQCIGCRRCVRKCPNGVFEPIQKTRAEINS